MIANKTVQILSGAESGQYGVLAAIAYNVEHITAFVQAAESRRSPLILQLFPSTLKQLPSLIFAASAAARSAAVPVSVHLDHAQDVEQIYHAAYNLPFDSIMVDMSHFEKEENIAKTKELTAVCHAKGIAVEAENGRIEGGEDGIADTGSLEGLLTSPEDVEAFVATKIDMLAPSIGNIHGDYSSRGPQLDFDRLRRIKEQVGDRVRIVLHGTNDFEPALMRQCIESGVTKINVNKLLLEPWNDYLRKNALKSLSQLIDEGILVLQKETERWMDIVGSSGKA